MNVHDIQTPYLLFLGDSPDRPNAKTATGVQHWRPEACVGELRFDGCEVTTGVPRMTVREAVQAGAKTLVIGVANAGGFVKAEWIDSLVEAIEAGLDIASGLHVRLGSIPQLREAAERTGRKLHDVRHFEGTLDVGNALPRSGHRLLTVGTDCSVGKMFTALAIEKEMRARGVDADFRATGQTGILIAGDGIAVDAVVADFISGAIERITPPAAADHWDLIEGQGSLFHPSFAGVSLGLLHGAQAEALVMCHEPGRKHVRGLPHHPVVDIVECIEANEAAARLTCPTAKVIGVAANTSALDPAAAEAAMAEISERTGLPCVDPVRTGVSPVVDALGL